MMYLCSPPCALSLCRFSLPFPFISLVAIPTVSTNVIIANAPLFAVVVVTAVLVVTADNAVVTAGIVYELLAKLLGQLVRVTF
jgi:hypothetical protein